MRSTGHRSFVFRSRLLALIWVIVGVALAAQKHYLDHIHGWRGVVSAVLAILLWPLLLLGHQPAHSPVERRYTAASWLESASS